MDIAAQRWATAKRHPVSADVLRLRAFLFAPTKALASLAVADLKVDVCLGPEDIWAIIRKPSRGGIALRIAHLPGGGLEVATNQASAGRGIQLEAQSRAGKHQVNLVADDRTLSLIRSTHVLTPSADLLIPYHPRDVYPLDENDDPTAAKGCVEASQRGPNTPVCYFRMTEPDFGTTLYIQNLTPMARYFESTKTKPDGAVGGRWPELGYLPPTLPQSAVPPENPLRKGDPVTVSDSILIFHPDSGASEASGARRFLQMLGEAYRVLDKPDVQYRDWQKRAAATVKDLKSARSVRLHHYGHLYIRPYTAAEYPDVMVQATLLAALRQWESHTGRGTIIADELQAGLGKFYHPKPGILQRYLPNVGKDKDAKAVDSWYLYHPLLMLGQMAIAGDAQCRRLLLKSLDYGIRAARHFDYHWPIQFKSDNFEIITEARNTDGLGQTDVGGLYAYVMLQAHQLTEDRRYLDEARRAIAAAKGMRFELEYQANLTAWGAAACARLWRVTNDDAYLQTGYVYLASFFHNCELWESRIGTARYFSNFMGATALHDAPYMAMFECADSFAAIEAYLRDGGPNLDPAARTLCSEYCRYALYRAWYYYPDALPPEAIAKQQRNGYIDRNLSFPLEDLYPHGEPAGQVGQEIYGAGGALLFAVRAFHDLPDVPFLIYCDQFATSREVTAKTSLTMQLTGGDDCSGLLCLVKRGRRKLPAATVWIGGEQLRPRHEQADRVEYVVPANGIVAINW
jgi:hypothetical protein